MLLSLKQFFFEEKKMTVIRATTPLETAAVLKEIRRDLEINPPPYSATRPAVTVLVEGNHALAAEFRAAYPPSPGMGARFLCKHPRLVDVYIDPAYDMNYKHVEGRLIPVSGDKGVIQRGDGTCYWDRYCVS